MAIMPPESLTEHSKYAIIQVLKFFDNLYRDECLGWWAQKSETVQFWQTIAILAVG